MKLYQYAFATLLLLGGLFVSCAKEETPMHESRYCLEIDLSDGGIDAGRATTDAHYSTQFSEGDRAGLYAVKEGAISNGIDNRSMTYTDGVWKLDEEVLYSGQLEGAIFYVYYPYNPTSEFDPATADPFSAKVAAWEPATDQTTEAAYTESDLMTGSATATLGGGRYTLSVTLKHRMGLVAVELPSAIYTFSNTDVALAPYTVKAANPSFALSYGSTETTVKPHYDEATGSYRLLVKSTIPCTLVGRFLLGGKGRKYTLDFPAGVAENTYEAYEIDGGVANRTMTLKVGDYYCADGSIVSYESGQPAPANAIGVIYRIGTTDGIQAAYPDCSHALVYALARTKRVVPSDVNDDTDYGEDEYLSIWSTQSAANSGVEKEWYANYGLMGDNNKYDASDLTTLNGFELSNMWLNLPLINEKDFAQVVRATHAAAVSAPGMTTGWYIPSYYELTLLNEQAELLNAALTTVGEPLWSGIDSSANNFCGYWSSTMRARNAVCGYKPNEGAITAYLNSRKGYFRFALAF